MKGAVFIGLSNYIEAEFGLTIWLKAIEQSDLSSNGEYLSVDLYQDSELNTLLANLAPLTALSREKLLRNFGEYFFPTLMSLAKQHVEHIDNLFEFLVAVDNIIHIEVQKSDPLAYTPTLFYDSPSKDVLVMRYISNRKMCHFAEGLILGAANYFSQPVTLSQSMCMCKGDKHCLIRIKQ